MTYPHSQQRDKQTALCHVQTKRTSGVSVLDHTVDATPQTAAPCRGEDVVVECVPTTTCTPNASRFLVVGAQPAPRNAQPNLAIASLPPLSPVVRLYHLVNTR